MPLSEQQLDDYRTQLRCGFAEIDAVFADCVQRVHRQLGAKAVETYLKAASIVAQTGRGVEPVLGFMQAMPETAVRLGEDSPADVANTIWQISRSPNGKYILAFVQSLPAVLAKIHSYEELQAYGELVLDFMRRTSGSIHGNQNATIPSPALGDLLQQMPYLLQHFDSAGLSRWIDYGVRHYVDHPERQQNYFRGESPDSRAIMQRERSGTQCERHRRELELYLKAFWDLDDLLISFTVDDAQSRQMTSAVGYFDEQGMRVPDVYHDSAVSGLGQYRALLSHMAAHRRWSEPMVADNYSPFQRLAIEVFEDCRVEQLAMRCYPGLRGLWMALHPSPGEDDCDPAQQSCILLRLAVFSRAILDDQHRYVDADLLSFVQRFHQLMSGQADTRAVEQLALQYVARTRRQRDLAASVYFDNTVVSYRDDNRHLWIFLEEGDEEDSVRRQASENKEDSLSLPPKLYPEWDYSRASYKPQWVSVYERLHPAGDAGAVDAMLDRHRGVAKQLKQVLELLKPHHYVRERYQEDGSELDLDVALRSMVDLKSGCNPDPRINMHHRHDGRDIAVMLLLDLSQSLNQTPAGSEQSLLALSQEAVALLGWSIDVLGDELAIAGFNSNTRHNVEYQHIKGFSEQWGASAKGRLAAVEARYSTRMGAAMRHAAHTLKARSADKKLLLVLTDGEPHDVDEGDAQLLIADAHKAVQELKSDGLYSYCVNLDPQADEYVQDIFGSHYTVIDQVQSLPQKLTQLFLSLTR